MPVGPDFIKPGAGLSDSCGSSRSDTDTARATGMPKEYDALLSLELGLKTSAITLKSKCYLYLGRPVPLFRNDR